MWTFESRCTIPVEISFAARDGADRRERHEFRNTPTTYGTYLYHVRRPRRQDRPERAYSCGCSSKRRREQQPRSHDRCHRCCDVEETCRGRPPARSAAVRWEEKEGKPRGNRGGGLSSSFARRHQYQPSYCVQVNVWAATEDVIARLVTDADVQEVRVHWRNGDSEPLHRSITVAALADDAVYLELRNRRSKCYCW